MKAGRIVVLAGASVLALGTLVSGGTDAAGLGPCSPTPTRTLTGAQTAAFTGPLAANERVDANAASWTGTTKYPVYFDDTGGDSCWDGASIKGTFAVTTTWNAYHDTAGFGFSSERFTLDHPRIFNYGDGIRVRDNTDGFLIKDAYLSYIHDDCVENDRLVTGTVTNSYLDGCYVAFSARRNSGTTFDGSLNTWTISDSLVRLQAMPTVYSGSAAGHGGFFKWDDNAPVSPKLNISNTIFRADQTTNHQSLNLPAGYNVTCSNNTMVWLGPGAFPGSLPSCFTVTTDRSVWDSAARAWDIAHPGVVTGPEVSIGDASVIESNESTRLLRFPLSLSTAPGTGNTVTVYWTTAPGTAGTSDFTPTKGKVLFTGAQVHKTVTVAVKGDTSDESNELMYALVAGVDGGENHRERGTGTIVDDDPGSGIRLAVSDALVVEGDATTRSLVIEVALTNPATSAVSIKWSTLGTGSAAAGSDYTTKSGTVNIPVGARQNIFTVPILPNTISEGTENFQVVINSATNATIIDNTGVITIRDDD